LKPLRWQSSPDVTQEACKHCAEADQSCDKTFQKMTAFRTGVSLITPFAVGSYISAASSVLTVAAWMRPW
ncbi:MAG: hypothetical protein ABSE73_29315, partial [Planctomycetota bacterium]